MKKMQHRATVKIKKLEEQMKREQTLKIATLSKTESSAEYLKIEDSVMKSIIPLHNWLPTITKIEKVTNMIPKVPNCWYIFLKRVKVHTYLHWKLLIGNVN